MIITATGRTGRSAALFNRIGPARDAIQPLIDPQMPSYDFDVIAGVTYAVDVTRLALTDSFSAVLAGYVEGIARK